MVENDEKFQDRTEGDPFFINYQTPWMHVMKKQKGQKTGWKINFSRAQETRRENAPR